MSGSAVAGRAGQCRWKVTGSDYQPGEVYRLIRDPETDEMVLQSLNDGAWYGLYGFERAPVPRIDVDAANHLCATWEQTPFSANMMLHRLAPQGRIGVFNTKVSTVCDGVKTVRELTDTADLERLLVEDFDLRLDEEDVARIADRLGLAEEVEARSVA